VPALRPRRGQVVGGRMTEYIIMGVIAVGILLYLAYALLFPEKF
jgi:K+-transporting ATPase KdpF subunit